MQIAPLDQHLSNNLVTRLTILCCNTSSGSGKWGLAKTIVGGVNGEGVVDHARPHKEWSEWLSGMNYSINTQPLTKTTQFEASS